MQLVEIQARLEALIAGADSEHQDEDDLRDYDEIARDLLDGIIKLRDDLRPNQSRPTTKRVQRRSGRVHAVKHEQPQPVGVLKIGDQGRYFFGETIHPGWVTECGEFFDALDNGPAREVTKRVNCGICLQILSKRGE